MLLEEKGILKKLFGSSSNIAIRITKPIHELPKVNQNMILFVIHLLYVYVFLSIYACKECLIRKRYKLGNNVLPLRTCVLRKN